MKIGFIRLANDQFQKINIFSRAAQQPSNYNRGQDPVQSSSRESKEYRNYRDKKYTTQNSLNKVNRPVAAWKEVSTRIIGILKQLLQVKEGSSNKND